MNTSGHLRIIARETGTALAVLAIWLMLLLAPLHQTAGLLRAFAQTGHNISGAWSICTTLAHEDGAKAQSIPVCPGQGIGKTDILAPPPVALPARFATILHLVQPQIRAGQTAPHRPRTTGLPRAPPLAA